MANSIAARPPERDMSNAAPTAIATDAAAFDTTEADGGVYVTLVPEPSSSFFAVAGLGMLLLMRRRN